MYYTMMYILSHVHSYFGEDYDDIDCIPEWKVISEPEELAYCRESDCLEGKWRWWKLRPGWTWIFWIHEHGIDRSYEAVFDGNEWNVEEKEQENIIANVPVISVTSNGSLDYLSAMNWVGALDGYPIVIGWSCRHWCS